MRTLSHIELSGSTCEADGEFKMDDTWDRYKPETERRVYWEWSHVNFCIQFGVQRKKTVIPDNFWGMGNSSTLSSNRVWWRRFWNEYCQKGMLGGNHTVKTTDALPVEGGCLLILLRGESPKSNTFFVNGLSFSKKIRMHKMMKRPFCISDILLISYHTHHASRLPQFFSHSWGVSGNNHCSLFEHRCASWIWCKEFSTRSLRE